MRASVHIKLPNLSKKMKDFKAITDMLHLQVRGIHGEHSETNNGVFDISNKRSLGRSEKEIVQDLIFGVRALIDAEMEIIHGPKKTEEEILLEKAREEKN